MLLGIVFRGWGGGVHCLFVHVFMFLVFPFSLLLIIPLLLPWLIISYCTPVSGSVPVFFPNLPIYNTTRLVQFIVGSCLWGVFIPLHS